MNELELLGFTKEELRERAIERICDKMLEAHFYDHEEGEPPKSMKFSKALMAMIERRIEQAVQKVAAETIKPSIEEFVRGFQIQETNAYGEKRGAPVTFTEFLVARAEAYIKEPVDHNGLSQAEARAKGNSWHGATYGSTRVVHLIHEYFAMRMKGEMEKAVQAANNAIAGGIEAAVQLSLKETAAKLKVEVKTK